MSLYKDLNIEFVTKKRFVTRMQCKNAIKRYSSLAYFTHAAGMILCAMAIELHVEFRD